jgi:hypothetical protein
MLKIIKDELDMIEAARVDAREEQEEADLMATSDFFNRLHELEAENWEWWKQNRA